MLSRQNMFVTSTEIRVTSPDSKARQPKPISSCSKLLNFPVPQFSHPSVLDFRSWVGLSIACWNHLDRPEPEPYCPLHFLALVHAHWGLLPLHLASLYHLSVLPWWLSSEESTCPCKRHGLNPWIVKTPGEGNGNPPQNSCLGNPMDRGAGWATVHGVTKELAMS